MLDTPTLAAQLRHPHGAAALAVAESMNRSNGALNRTAIALLAVQANEHVLEIGPGNAAFVPLLLTAPGSRYLGVELSSAMVHAGNRLLRDQGLADLEAPDPCRNRYQQCGEPYRQAVPPAAGPARLTLTGG